MTIYRVRTAWTGGPGGGLLSTMYFSSLGGTPAQANSAVGTFWTSLAASLSNQLTARTDAAVFLIDENTGQPTGITGVTPVVIACTQSGEALPFSNQGVVQWRTGTFINGRELRGRTFIPGITETNANAGVLAPALITTLNNAAAALIADANSDLAVYSPTNHTFDSVVSGNTWTQFGVLRSRRL